ncbi:MAG: DUF1998 domain-containing protein, partial [bacterium]|nr:DUF1998 domain-containing protein [bacterium]
LQCVSLTFVDPSLGGTGYLRRIATDFDGVSKAAIEHLSHDNCETSCYRCLKNYRNQRFHEFLNWTTAIDTIEELAQLPTIERKLETGDINDPRPWLAAYSEGMGSPLEAKFWAEFVKLGFKLEKQYPIFIEGSPKALTIADFAVPEKRIAMYIDGTTFHVGQNLRRDRFIREKLRGLALPWRVIVLQLRDITNIIEIVRENNLDLPKWN